MKKRILSFLLAIVMLLGILPLGVFSAFADDFETQMRNKGFPESYIPYLTELHKKYPKWKFEVLDTNETWEYAVSQERKPHKQQVIQKYSGNDGKGYYCECSSCYKNGKYVIQEGSSWVSASQKAVEFYMDPRNFLDERYILQFETIFSNKDATQAGVEAILKGTWMYNSLITYKDENGKNVTYSPQKKYSEAIMEAAKNSNISAYYIASKIVQEVGGKTNSAGGASGTYTGYEGIYNYYNIGANTGAKDGLKWASTSSAGYKTNCVCKLREQPTTLSAQLASVPYGTTVMVVSTTATQPDGYKWYNVKVKLNGTQYTGYIRSDLVDGGTQDKYNRPWTNPYLSIYNGAAWIANNYDIQHTGYLQKFNVNPKSSVMHGHEYMANVQGAASEAALKYKAYSNAGILATEKTFYIPVFSNMGVSYEVTNVKVSNVTTSSLRISYDKIELASGYEIQIRENGGAWKHFVNTGYNDKEWSGFTPCVKYEVRVRGYKTVGTSIVYSETWSNVASFSTKPLKVENVRTTWRSANGDRIKLQWNAQPKADGYKIYKRAGGAWKEIANVKGGNEAGYVIGGLTPDTKYEFAMRAYKTGEGNLGAYSDAHSTFTLEDTTKLTSKIKNLAVSSGVNSVRISFDKVSGVDGYEIQLYKDGVWKRFVTTGYNDKEWTNLEPAAQYRVRVRTFKKVNGEAVYEPIWSKEIGFSTKPLKVENVRTTWRSLNGDRIKLQWNAQPKADGYKIYKRAGGAWKEIANIKGGNEAGYVIGGLTPNTKYEFAMRAYKTGEGNLGAYSAAHSTFTNPDLSYLNSLVVKNVKTVTTAETVRISYDKISQADGYEIQIYKNGAWKHFVNTGYCDKEWSAFAPATEYRVRVRAYKIINGNVVYADKWSAEPRFFTKPLKVTGVKKLMTTADASSIVLTWDKIDAADGYKVYKKTNAGWQLIKTINGADENTAMIDVTPTYFYTFAVRAFKGGEGNLGAYSNACETYAASIMPTVISAASNSKQTIDVKWSSVFCHGYEITWSTSPTFLYNTKTMTVNSNASSAVIKTAQGGTTYYVAVRSFCRRGDEVIYSVMSPIKEVKVK